MSRLQIQDLAYFDRWRKWFRNIARGFSRRGSATSLWVAGKCGAGLRPHHCRPPLPRRFPRVLPRLTARVTVCGYDLCTDRIIDPICDQSLFLKLEGEKVKN